MPGRLVRPSDCDRAMRMAVHDLNRLKSRVAREYRESPGIDLQGMIVDCHQAIERSELLTVTAVRKTGGHAHQIEAECRPVKPDIPVQRLAAELQRIWQEELRYDDFAAHALDATDHRIVLDFLTVAREPRLYLTGMIVVALD